MRYLRCVSRKFYNTNVIKNTQKTFYPISNINKPRNEVAIIVVGGGLAGLSAANHLIEHGFKQTIVLEATDRCGGRIISKQFGDAYCELGAKWVPINANKNTIYNMVRNMRGLPKKVIPSNDRMYVNTYGERVDKKLPELIDILYKRVCTHIQFDEKYKTGEMEDLNSVHTYFKAETSKLVNSVFKGHDQKTANEIFNSLIKEFGSLLGCSLEYLNIEHITKLASGVNNNNYIYIPTGLDNILSILTRNLGKKQLLMGKPVGEINWFLPSKVGEKSVACLDGDVYRADHIICTVPLGVLKIFSENMFKPALPQNKLNSIKKLGFGSPVKIYLEYEANIESWLRSSLRPLWTADDTANKELAWTKQVVEIAKMPKSNRVVEVVIGGAFYDKIEKLPDLEVVTEITKLLRTLLKNQSIPYPTSMLRSNWGSLACYLGGRPYFSTGSTINDVLTLAEPLGPTSLLFAGDATIVEGFGTVDGAHKSGIREAQRIIDHYNRQMAV